MMNPLPTFNYIPGDVRTNCRARNSSSQDCQPSIMSVIIAVALFLVILGVWYSLSQEQAQTKQKPVKLSDDPCDSHTHVKHCKALDNTKQELKSWMENEIKSSDVCQKNSKFKMDDIRKIVKEEIKKQHSDGLKPDFASKSAGAMILDASDTWTDGYEKIYFFFLLYKSLAPAPSTLLEPWTQAGDCWPMKGKKGYVVIRLAARTKITGFTMEHIDPAMSLTGSTPEAPSNFSVHGLEDPYDTKSHIHKFGDYIYKLSLDEKQCYRVNKSSDRSYSFVKLAIEGNHGHEHYTCLYRFQVHGTIDRAYNCQ